MSSWLPAVIVHGEGIFMEFDQDRLKAGKAIQRSKVGSGS